MKILQVLTYYQPHVSGLTIYVDRLSRALARKGHEVTVLTSQYEPELPITETDQGVNIRRVPVFTRLSKGVLMPSFGPTAWRMVRDADIIHLHLPQFDAPGVAFRGRLLNKPVVLTYHSDLQLPAGMVNRFIDLTVYFMNRLAGSLADVVVTYTRDFGAHSPFLSRYVGSKLVIIPPPVELEEAADKEVKQFARSNGLGNRPTIGISARLAAEKGVEVLLRALPLILEVVPNALILHAGPVENVLGEEDYAARLAPLFEKHQENYKQVGTLRGAELTAFYRSLSCLVLCSLNNTETFGLVQIEAMMNGVPVVASNLPGVRQPLEMTGFGEITPVGDHEALAAALIRILNHPVSFSFSPKLIKQTFNPDNTAHRYITLYNDLLEGKPIISLVEPKAYDRLRQESRNEFEV